MVSTALRRSDLVEVRSPAEILSTLDENGCLEGLPFMPEMVAHCGGRFVVDKRANKICDTTQNNSGSRELPDTVLLGELRCDGSAHQGCQQSCRMFWKESWLRKVAPADPPSAPAPEEDVQRLLALVRSAMKRPMEAGPGAHERWRCQLTELYDASSGISVWNPCSYLKQFTSGNIGLGHCLRVSARATVEEPMRWAGVFPHPHLRGTATGPVYETLDLKPGEWVQVKSKEEIRATLLPTGMNRGLWFDREMAVYCDGKYRVKQRITRFIDDQKFHGRMIEMKTDAVTLEGVVCIGDLSHMKWFCPREIPPFWRECWLRRTTPPTQS